MVSSAETRIRSLGGVVGVRRARRVFEMRSVLAEEASQNVRRAIRLACTRAEAPVSADVI